MAYPNPKNGAFTFGTPSMAGIDFASFEYSESQATESVAAYGAGTYDPHRGSGTPHASTTVAGFTKVNAANSQPFGATVMSAAGGTATLTIDTGVSVAATMIMSNARISHARLRAAIPLTFGLEGGGDATITWPTS